MFPATPPRLCSGLPLVGDCTCDLIMKSPDSLRCDCVVSRFESGDMLHEYISLTYVNEFMFNTNMQINWHQAYENQGSANLRRVYNSETYQSKPSKTCNNNINVFWFNP